MTSQVRFAKTCEVSARNFGCSRRQEAALKESAGLFAHAVFMPVKYGVFFQFIFRR
jgi:hypothetical protein